ncbi:MAG: thiamine biosynthesis protein [Hyphomicrobiales bacterium]|nr:thiamine biosynthesis protein [Hyphomicrobiales bacterium]
MRETRIIMGMPITIDIVGVEDSRLHELAFGHFDAVDRRFSTYKADSEISAINGGELEPPDYSDEMREVLALAETTRWETDGYFDVRKPDGSIDPSGIVKGWAIRNAARLLRAAGAMDFFVDAGGDIESSGSNAEGGAWRVGIRHPFDPQAIVKVIYPRGRGVATSGSYVRGQHIYDPHRPGQTVTDIVSLTVIGSDVLEADRFATAAFAMGSAGIGFVESVRGLEGYSIDAAGIATMTSHFEALTQP